MAALRARRVGRRGFVGGVGVVVAGVVVGRGICASASLRLAFRGYCCGVGGWFCLGGLGCVEILLPAIDVSGTSALRGGGGVGSRVRGW